MLKGARVVPNCQRSWRLALIQTFSMFCVHISIDRVYKVVLMHDDVVQVDGAIVQVDAAIQPSDMTCVPERHPYWISGNNVGPVLALTTCSMRRPLSLHCTKHPQTVHDSASLVFPTMKVGLLDLDDDRLPSVVEATDLRLLSPRVLRTDVWWSWSSRPMSEARHPSVTPRGAMERQSPSRTEATQASPVQSCSWRKTRSVDDSAAMVLSAVKVRFVDLQDDRLPSIVEATELRLLSPQTSRPRARHPSATPRGAMARPSPTRTEATPASPVQSCSWRRCPCVC